MEQDIRPPQNQATLPGNNAAQTEPPAPPPAAPKKSGRKLIYAVVLVAIIIAAGAIGWTLHKPTNTAPNATAAVNPAGSAGPAPAEPQSSQAGLKLSSTKNYGDKYADGILPVGDGRYTAAGAKTGYAYVCSNYANNLRSQPGGAMVRGPWFIGTTKYDINKKPHVRGSVTWKSNFSDKLSGGTRVITSNDLPNHPTGTFPISSSDPAYAYDRNPNSIQAQSFTYDLSARPSYGDPGCIGGQVGVMLTGTALFSGFDAAGRDAGAWEVQDSCGGHPQSGGVYHYHTLSGCIKDTRVKTVIGFALDGFPITGPKVGAGNILTTGDLDECHGLTSQIVLDGKSVTMYHYVMTQDFPYSVSCYRGTAIQPPGQRTSPGRP